MPWPEDWRLDGTSSALASRPTMAGGSPAGRTSPLHTIIERIGTVRAGSRISSRIAHPRRGPSSGSGGVAVLLSRTAIRQGALSHVGSRTGQGFTDQSLVLVQPSCGPAMASRLTPASGATGRRGGPRPSATVPLSGAQARRANARPSATCGPRPDATEPLTGARPTLDRSPVGYNPQSSLPR